MPQVPRVSGLPWRLLRIGGVVVPLWRELAEMKYLWEVSHALDDTSLLELVGELQTTPLNEALRRRSVSLACEPSSHCVGGYGVSAVTDKDGPHLGGCVGVQNL